MNHEPHVILLTWAMIESALSGGQVIFCPVWTVRRAAGTLLCGAPSYLGPFTYVADLPSRRGLRSSCSDCLVQLPVHRSTVAAEHFRLLALRCGTVCHRRLRGHRLWRPSALDSRRFCSLSHILTFGSSDIVVSTHWLSAVDLRPL